MSVLAGAPAGKHCRQGAAASPAIRFRNVAEAAGLRFVYQHSPTPEKYFVESVPGGVAVFDYNGDGRPDIFFTNGAKTPALDKASPIYSNRLYRNDGGMRFTDVTVGGRRSGIGYAMGAAAGDFDNDGHVDLFVAGVRTQSAAVAIAATGDSRTSPKAAGIASGDCAVGGGWFDYDNDGRLDLLVVNYVQWSADTNPATAATRRGGSASTAIRASSRGCRTASTAIAATARSRTCRRAPACRRTSARA